MEIPAERVIDRLVAKVAILEKTNTLQAVTIETLEAAAHMSENEPCKPKASKT
jgi:hypothetical protein